MMCSPIWFHIWLVSVSGVLLQSGCLVLYRSRSAVVVTLAEKVEIRFQSGQTKRVREKDVTPLHPGPVDDLSKLSMADTPLEEAWELLSGETCNLSELADLIYGELTPASIWSAWKLVADGLYFEGTTEQVHARPADLVIADKQARDEKRHSEEDWKAFLDRARKGSLIEQDFKRLSEVEMLANGQIKQSKILASLEIKQTVETGHGFLLKCGYWKPGHNPYPRRLDVSLDSLSLEVPELPLEQRLDLRHLDAFVIDDEGNQDPDDAISLDGDRIWVHVADVAALAPPDSDLDRAARERVANLYLPETTVSMLPEQVTRMLGLGLEDESPALSVGFCFKDGDLVDIDVQLSTIAATRLSYQEADDQLLQSTQDKLTQLLAVSQSYRARRLAEGAIELDFPEVSIRTHGDDIHIRPLERITSRQMVTDLMLMAGEAVARFAVDKEIPIPFVEQPEPETRDRAETLSGHYAFRRFMRPSLATTVPGRHAGLGLQPYTRVTSPLRRYLDLVTHQQLRAYLNSTDLLPQDVVESRIGQTQQAGNAVRKTERFSNLHWKLVYLQRHPDWQGEAIVVEMGPRKATLIIPSLAMETKIRLSDQMVIDKCLMLGLKGVDLPGQTAYFQILNGC